MALSSSLEYNPDLFTPKQSNNQSPKPVLIFYICSRGQSDMQTRIKLAEFAKQMQASNPSLYNDYHVIILDTEENSKVELV